MSVVEACYLQEERMAKDYRRLTEEATQGVLLDDAGFLREIVERKLQEFLEAQMPEHVGAAPYELTIECKGHRNGHKMRTLRTRVGTLNLLVPRIAKARSPPGRSRA
jgi:transposase-like protein